MKTAFFKEVHLNAVKNNIETFFTAKELKFKMVKNKLNVVLEIILTKSTKSSRLKNLIKALEISPPNIENDGVIYEIFWLL